MLGRPVAHSLSPVLHGAAYRALGLDWSYERVDCGAEDLPPLVRDLPPEWVGLSVTMPGKRAALEVASRATDRAHAVGAANTLVRHDDGWHADCTDVDGVAGALRCAAGFTEGERAVLLGAGATACAALAALVELDVPDAVLVVRDLDRAARARQCAARLGMRPLEVVLWSATDFADLAASADVLVSTVPTAATEPIAAELAAASCVLDVIYHPWPTPLAQAVQGRGGRVATGLDMLLHQAFGQVEQFTGLPAPRGPMRDALAEATGNIIPLPV